jgi:hypothetical protein
MAEVGWTRTILKSNPERLPAHALKAYTEVKKVSRDMHAVEDQGFSGTEYAIFDGGIQISVWLFTEMAAWTDAYERVCGKRARLGVKA